MNSAHLNLPFERVALLVLPDSKGYAKSKACAGVSFFLRLPPPPPSLAPPPPAVLKGTLNNKTHPYHPAAFFGAHWDRGEASLDEETGLQGF